MTQLSEDIDRLTAFVSGAMSPDETDQLIEALVQDEEALAVVDQLWQDQPSAEALSMIASDEEALTPRQQLENKLFRSIQRSELSNKMIQFGTLGFLDVVIAMTKPLFSPNRSPSKPNRNNQDG